GSVVTYLKRYSLSAVFGITSDIDDDGNAAQQGNAPSKQAPPKTASNLLSPKQRTMIGAKIKALSEKFGLEQVEVYKLAQEKTGINKSTGELTPNEASKIIEYLITQEG